MSGNLRASTISVTLDADKMNPSQETLEALVEMFPCIPDPTHQPYTFLHYYRLFLWANNLKEV